MKLLVAGKGEKNTARNLCDPWQSGSINRVTENMQFKKVKKEIINCKKRDFVQTCRFYAQNRVFLQIERNVVQKSTRMHKF